MRNLTLLPIALAAACGPAEEFATQDDALTTRVLPAEGTPAAVGALLFVQDCSTTVAKLDVDARLYSTAARAIILARDGADGLCGTSDDFRFQWLSNLLALADVGPGNIARLADYVVSTARAPNYAGGTVEDVTFTDAEAHNTLVKVNAASFFALDAEAGIRSDSARNIDAARPLPSIEALGDVRMVSTATLKKLKAWANPTSTTNSPATDEPAPSGYLLSEAELAGLQQNMYESLSEDEGFARTVADLAGWNEEIYGRIIRALEAEIARLTAPFLGKSFPSRSDALDALWDAAPVKSRTRNEGWSYLKTLGVTPPAPSGFVLDGAEYDSVLQMSKEGFWENENFSGYVVELAGGGEDENIPTFTRIMQALEAELDRKAAPLRGTVYPSFDDAADAVGNLRHAIESRVESEGWDYLATLGVTR